MTSITLLLILAATAALAWAGTGLIIRNAVAWGLEDIPNERSSHTRVTPRGDEPVNSGHVARLWLNDAVAQVLANGLGLLGVSAPERM